MSAGELYQVLYFGPDGKEALTDPESRADAESIASALGRGGYEVGAVMSENEARRYWRHHYASEYRGIPVPDGLRSDGATRAAYDAWRSGVDAALDAAVPLLRALADPRPCEQDEPGSCIVHDYPPPLCADGEAQRLLAASREEDG